MIRLLFKESNEMTLGKIVKDMILQYIEDEYIHKVVINYSKSVLEKYYALLLFYEYTNSEQKKQIENQLKSVQEVATTFECVLCWESSDEIDSVYKLIRKINELITCDENKQFKVIQKEMNYDDRMQLIMTLKIDSKFYELKYQYLKDKLQTDQPLNINQYINEFKSFLEPFRLTKDCFDILITGLVDYINRN